MKHIFIIIFFCLVANLHSQWFQQHVLTDMNILLSIDFYDTNTGVSCGRNDSLGKVVFTTNSGTNWVSGQVPDSTRACVTIQFINSQTAYITGAYNLTGSGKLIKKTPVNKNAHLMDYLTMIGNDRSAYYKGLFLKTTNGGINWFAYGELPDSVYFLIGMNFLNSSIGYVTGDKSETTGEAVILKTTNGGLNWSYQNIPQGINTLRNILFLDFSTGFAVGYRRINDTLFQSVILKTVNGGSVWSEGNISGMDNIDAIDFPNSTTGFVAAFSTESFEPFLRIYKTTNTGTNWMQSSNMIQAYTSGIEFLYNSGIGVSFGTWFSVVDSSFVLRTTNYGLLWDFQYLPIVNFFLTESCIVDANNWYLCGGGFTSNGVILKTTNGGGPVGIKPVGSEIPDEFKLYQNYPNPFNPKTIINYELRITSDVKLSVYDVNGKHVIDLVNQKQNSGKYGVDFYSNGFPSGVYFYKLEVREAGSLTGAYVMAKIMVLLK